MLACLFNLETVCEGNCYYEMKTDAIDVLSFTKVAQLQQSVDIYKSDEVKLSTENLINIYD